MQNEEGEAAISQDPRQEPVQISVSDLSQEALEGLIDDHLIREMGTDHDQEPMKRRDQALEALQQGKATIWFYPSEQQVSLSFQ